MSESRSDIIVPSTNYISLNATAVPPIPVGTAFNIQCKGTSWCLLYEGSTLPTPTSEKGVLITDLSYKESSKLIPAGSLEIFAICTQEGRTSKLIVQEV